MKPRIICTNPKRGIHTFWLVKGSETYYLFSQRYRKGVDSYYTGGVELNRAMCFALARRDTAVMRTMDKLPIYIRYVEKENGIAVLDQTLRAKRDRACTAA